MKYKYQFALVPKRNIISKPRTIDDRMLYVLGWIMGDGYCNPKSNEVKITY
nr:MAG TPA: HOMING ENDONUCLEASE I-DMOI [Caudoviricetes sp.]DAR45846.1 MAG TPA: HOMING ENDONUCLEASE I-DMOI [Bacteriophage sp.]